MEYLDTYDEKGNFIKKEERGIVHKLGLWHNTVHCWLYDASGNVYFQIRSEEKKLYTTASGHVNAGETIKEAFGREIKEEIGLTIDYETATLVDIVTWKMDQLRQDGSIFKDRAFSNVYICELKNENSSFHFDLKEVLGLVKVNAKEVLSLFEKEIGQIKGTLITIVNGKVNEEIRSVDFKEFLVQSHETALEKYGNVLRKIIELTNA